MKNSIVDLLRSNIKSLLPYKSARDDFRGQANIYLDANESPFPTDYNRYPDPQQKALKAVIAKEKTISTENVFLGNGSDEIIDLLIRAFCEPKKDKIIAIDPSYGMYEVSANINAVELVKCPLDKYFNLDFELLKSMITPEVKIVFICNPNNPTGNGFSIDSICELASELNILMVVDEAYIDFSSQASMIELVNTLDNLVVIQTLSKSYGAAALRIGMAFASNTIVSILNKIKPPYNISGSAQKAALDLFKNIDSVKDNIKLIVSERERLKIELTAFDEVKHVYNSEANFLLVKVEKADVLYQFLISKGIVVRNRHGLLNCDNCLRITVGTPNENQELLTFLNQFYNAEDIVFG